jgi:undecaprenyl-diphosphatase
VSYLQAFIIAVVQGVTELFPVSSLGHSVLIPAWIGGSWQTMVTQSSQASSETSFCLAYIVALHCATALALLWFLPRRLGPDHPRPAHQPAARAA